MAKTLRQLMTDGIAHGDWLDYVFDRVHTECQRRNESVRYRDWLDSLDDDDFLDTYNRVRDAQNQLD